jgi:tRNA modification GTPase
VYPRDTIAAIATAGGAGALAIIRVSGVDAAAVARRVFRGTPPEGWQSHRLYAGRFADAGGRLLDRGLAVLMRGPRSYTGEDVLELHCHGGVLLARRLLGAVIGAGARAARPGEFTLRAFLNGKLDLAQAESVADLIAARTDAALQVAAEQLGGALSRVVEHWREQLIGIAARLEVAIDFSEEDVGDLDRAALENDASRALGALTDLAATYARGRILREGVRVAIVGKPNAGKSSWLNCLLGAERAIVTPVPGTTRDVIEEAIDVDGLAVVLVDTAGLRSSTEEVERIGIGRTHAQIAEADVVLVVLDHGKPWQAEDAAVLDATRQKKRILLINKADLPRHLEVPSAVVDGAPVIRGSALDGSGAQQVRSEILRTADFREQECGAVIVTRERQRQALESAAAAIQRAVEALRAGYPPDVIAVDIMAALDHLGELVGRTSPEAVLDRIFSEFCIGK